MTYRKNTKKLFNLVGIEKNMTQLKNQISKKMLLTSRVPAGPQNTIVSIEDKSEEDLDGAYSKQNILRAIQDAINEFVES